MGDRPGGHRGPFVLQGFVPPKDDVLYTTEFLRELGQHGMRDSTTTYTSTVTRFTNQYPCSDLYCKDKRRPLVLNDAMRTTLAARDKPARGFGEKQ